MNELRLTSKPELIEKLTSDFIKIESDSNTWGTFYLCPKTNENWQKIYVETEYHGGGHPVLFKLPDPRKLDLINIALNSEDLDEIASASALLLVNEKELKEEFREDLINAIENKVSQKDFIWNKLNSEKIKSIISETQLFDKTNRRPILGKKNIEIEKDFEFYKDISERAKKIITTANTV
ncbi:Imm27 family immunity protein [Yeosuana marina]|uniref:Imm27 family immunity protein n=1 Tax=Yeosuana marina TaxID=1565536 RepID=UPI0030EC35CE|tara:strand:- start:33 stop:572 length:540 start_codon:yes stop_codon:yes gene_type:complete